MIKAIVIDDEEHVRQDVCNKLENNFSQEINVIAQAESISNALELVEKFEPDLLFLDVNLQDGTGFDLLKQCNFKKMNVIFVTGFDQHALKAIKVGALDYILKPIDELEFNDAVVKAIKSNHKDNHLEKLIEISSEYFNGVKNKRIILKTADNVYAIYEDDIVYCRSDGNYTTFYTQQMEKILVSKPIKKIEETLSEDVFIRCHQSYIVNKKHVLKYNKQGVLIVNLDIKIPVSSRRKEYALKRIFN